MNVYIVGTDARYQILRALAPSNMVPSNLFCKEHNFVVANDITAGAQNEDTETVKIASNCVPLYTRVHFPKSAEVPENQAWERTLVVEEFPSGTKQWVEYVMNLKKADCVTSVEVVLCNNQRAGLDTDLSNEQEALEETCTFYQERAVKVHFYENGKAMPFLYWQEENLAEQVKQKYAGYIEQVRETQGFLLPLMKEGFIQQLEEEGGLDPQVLQTLTCYRKELHGKNVTVFYCKEGRQMLFRDSREQLLEPVLNHYQDALQGVVPWDMHRDLELLEGRFKMEYDISCQKLKACKFFGKSDSDYVEFLHKTHGNITFKTMLEGFVKIRLWDIMEERLYQRLQQMEDLFNGKIESHMYRV